MRRPGVRSLIVEVARRDELLLHLVEEANDSGRIWGRRRFRNGWQGHHITRRNRQRPKVIQRIDEQAIVKAPCAVTLLFGASAKAVAAQVAFAMDFSNIDTCGDLLPQGFEAGACASIVGDFVKSILRAGSA